MTTKKPDLMPCLETAPSWCGEHQAWFSRCDKARHPAPSGLVEALEEVRGLLSRCEGVMNLTAAWLKNAPEAEHEVRRLQIAAGAVNRYLRLTHPTVPAKEK